MMYLTDILFLAIGLGLLVAGAEALVRGASRLAIAVGISPLVIGLTVVAYGTSAPEMAVSVLAGIQGKADLSLGNVVGSNIFNVLFILGVSAIIIPLAVAQQLIRLDVPIMIGVSVVVYLMGLDGNIGRAEGAVLFAGIIAYTVFLIIQSRKEKKEIEEEYSKEFGVPSGKAKRLALNAAYIMGGLAMLVYGSRLLVDGATNVATAFGVSDLVIGLTIVAAGTSLPEVATSVVASIRGERDIAVGNVVGSNIFNILAVLGLSSIVSREGINVNASAFAFDIPVMIAVAFACLPVFFTASLIARWEGFLLLGYYVAYTAYLVMDSSRHGALGLYGSAMMLFVIPLTVITLGVVTIRRMREARRRN
jgi:cation:H+ antiporter